MICDKTKLSIFFIFFLISFSVHSNVEINSWNELTKRGNTYFIGNDNLLKFEIQRKRSNIIKSTNIIPNLGALSADHGKFRAGELALE